ncbi:MAG: hypothetical protein ACRBCK_06280 [Alphaproteobacteria bacterium]
MAIKLQRKTFIYVVLLTFMLITGIEKPSFAQDTTQDIFSRFKKPLPDLPDISKEDFEGSTQSVNKKPYGQRVLEYSMRIPKEWKIGDDESSSNFLLSDKLFLELSKYYGKPTISGRSRIEISALNIDSNLTTEQWYLRYILESGYTTEGFVTRDDGSVESLMIVMEEDYSYYLRTRVSINGSKVIMVKYFVPIHYIQERAVMQEGVIDSFKLLNKVDRPEMETQIYRFLDVAEISYPPHWKVIAKPLRSVDRMNASIINTGEKKKGLGQATISSSTQGKMDVSLISSAVQNSLIDEIADYKEHIESSGILISEKIEEEYVFQYKDEIDFAITEVYKGVDSSSKLSEYELWFTVMVSGNYYYFLMLLTPSRNDSFATWAENTQNYKVMVKSFTPLAGAFLDRN